VVLIVFPQLKCHLLPTLLLLLLLLLLCGEHYNVYHCQLH
jgi:hypothetical protein